MGDCDRTAHRYLLLEDWNNGTVTSQDIAESCSNKLGNALYFAIHNRLVQCLAINLADSLAAAHHVGWVHSLIGRDHHKLPGAVLHSHIGYHTRTIYIILHCLGWIVPPSSVHAYSCGMEYIVWMIL